MIVLYAPGMLPSTCVLPSQRERIEKKRREKAQAIIEASREELKTIRKLGPSVNLSTLPSRMESIALCGYAVPIAIRSLTLLTVCDKRVVFVQLGTTPAEKSAPGELPEGDCR